MPDMEQYVIQAPWPQTPWSSVTTRIVQSESQLKFVKSIVLISWEQRKVYFHIPRNGLTLARNLTSLSSTHKKSGLDHTDLSTQFSSTNKQKNNFLVVGLIYRLSESRDRDPGTLWNCYKFFFVYICVLGLVGEPRSRLWSQVQSWLV